MYFNFEIDSKSYQCLVEAQKKTVEKISHLRGGKMFKVIVFSKYNSHVSVYDSLVQVCNIESDDKRLFITRSRKKRTKITRKTLNETGIIKIRYSICKIILIK